MHDMAKRRLRLLLLPVVLLLAVIAWPSASKRQGLWAYVGDGDDVEPWDWIRRQSFQVKHGHRRPSWGALKSQGARAQVRANLKDGQKYLTSFPMAGWNNQVMDVMNIAYIAFLSKRIPILMSFFTQKAHLGYDEPSIPVGDVFDLSRLSAMWDRPIVEMHELKAYDRLYNHSKSVVYDGEHKLDVPLPLGAYIPAEEPADEDIPCWSANMMWISGVGPCNAMRPSELWWTPLPRQTHIGNSRETCSLFEVAKVFSERQDVPDYSKERLAELGEPLPDLLPEEQFSCMDQAYFCSTLPQWRNLHAEWHAGDGAWGNVGVHMRFQPGLVRLAEDYLRHVFGGRPGTNDPVPPYMALHIRRGDFSQVWQNLTPRQYAYRAEQTLLGARGVNVHVDRIVVTTDEKDPVWLDQLRAYGFIIIDHSATRTGERLNWWMPTILDSIILSQAKVLLGNPSSTMTILAKRRVIDWNNGFVRMMDPVSKVPDGWEWGLAP